jgi:hypothetical protein
MNTVEEFWPDTGPMSGNSMTSKLLHGRLKKLSEQDIADATASYASGKSIADIARSFGVSRQSLWQVLTSRNVPMRSHKRYGKDNHFYRGGSKAIGAAQNKVEKAILHGRLVRPRKCMRCGEEPLPMKDGRPNIQAHHPDYSKPLEVLWLCQKCHHQEHKNASRR